LTSETKLPLVSVILPSYNRAYCIIPAVESVLRQTYENLELIIVDDCSTDNTVQVLSSISDQRLRIIRHDRNQGAAAARNTGLGAAEGELIAFQDSDDEWCISMLERQLQRRAELGPDFEVSYCAKVVHGRDDHGNFGPRYAAYVPPADRRCVEGEVLDEVFQKAIASTQTIVVTKRLIQAVGGFDETLRVGVDWELTVRLARKTKFAFIEEPLVMTRLMDDSITHRRLDSVHTIQVVIDKHKDLLEGKRKLHAAKEFQIARIYQRGGLYRKALPHLLKSIRMHPTNVRNWSALALSLARSAF
jgi:glycosyltransferase involved in cell wall biosynthesis